MPDVVVSSHIDNLLRSANISESRSILNISNNVATLSGSQFTGPVIATTLSATGSITASQSIIPVTVTNLSSGKVFVDADTNKIFHFNTSSSALTASFPSALSEGFNAAIMNTGTNYLYISSNTQLNAVSNKLIGIYTGAYVYKSGLNIFAVGGL
jgi:hypothetical protein